MIDLPSQEALPPSQIEDFVEARNEIKTLLPYTDLADNEETTPQEVQNIEPLPPEQSQETPAALSASEETPQEKEPLVVVENPAEEKDLLAFALSVCAVLEDGFQWSDIGPIVAWSIDYVNRFAHLTIEGQKADVKEIFNYIIDNTETPYLPDGFTDPLFKSLFSPFLDLAFAAFSGELHAEVNPLSDPTIAPTVEELKRYAYDICRTFGDGFQLEDLATVVRLAIESIEPFVTLTVEQRREAIVQIVYYVIDITDTPYLPDPWVDPIMKAMTPPFVDFILDIREHENLPLS